jgi:transglutaminase-like putative cysteine protease
MKTVVMVMFVVMGMLAGVAPAWSQARSGVVTIDVDLSKQEAGTDARLWLPYPVSDADQSVTGVKVSGDFSTSAVYTDTAHGTPILYAEWPKNAASRKLALTFHVDRREVKFTDLPTQEAPWDPADYRKYLAPTSLGPIDGEVRKLAKKIVAGKKGVLEKAKAIYDWTCESMYRDPDTRGCGKGDVCALLHKPGGKCTDISSVYIALCRAAGVPAREVFGIRLGKKPTQDITTWQHCWAEVFLPGTGWVPVDPADVRKAMLVEKLKPEDARTKELRTYFWGGIDPYRVKLAVGRDLVLNPPQAGPPLNTFGYPYAEIGGKPLDFYDPKAFSYTITYREK